MESVQPVDLDFGFEEVRIDRDLKSEELNGLKQPIEFTADIERVGSADSGIPFDYNLDGEFGFGIEIDVASLGDVSLEYPVNSELILPENARAGSTFKVATGDGFSSSAPEITSSSLSLDNSLRLYLISQLEPGGIFNLDLPFDFDDTNEDLENLLAYEGFARNETTLIDSELGVAGEISIDDIPVVKSTSVGEFLDSIGFNYNLPTGETESSTGEEQSPGGTLESIGLTTGDPLVSLDVNLLELISDLALPTSPLKSLGLLQEGRSIGSFSAEYTIFRYIYSRWV